MTNISKMLVVACSALLLPIAARANSLTNGSFETPTAPSGSFTDFASGSTGITGWTVVGASGGVSTVSTTFNQNGVAFEAEDGNQWLDLTGDGTNSTEGVQQAVTTTSGMSYVVSFYVGNTSGGNIFGTTSTVGLDINGSQVNSYTNSTADSSGLNWEQFSYTFTATGPSTTLGFINLDPGTDNSNGLDNVDVELSSASASTVPEPSSLLLLGTGMVGFAGMARRKVGQLLKVNRSQA